MEGPAAFYLLGPLTGGVMGWRDEYRLKPLPPPEEVDVDSETLEERVVPDAGMGGNLVLAVSDWLFGVDLETGAVEGRWAGNSFKSLAPAGNTLYAANGMTVVDLVRGERIRAEDRIRDITVHDGNLLATSGERVFDPFTGEAVVKDGGDVLASFDGRLYHAVTKSVGQDRYGIYDSMTGEAVVETGRVQDLVAGDRLYSVEITRPQGVGRSVHAAFEDNRELAYSSSGGDVLLAGSSEGVYAARRDRLYHAASDSDFDDALHSFPNEVRAVAAVPDDVYADLFEAV